MMNGAGARFHRTNAKRTALQPGDRTSIAFVSPRFSEQGTVGGAETLLKRLAEYAASADCDVSMLTTCAEDHFTWANTLPPGRKQVGALHVEYFPVDDNRDRSAFLRIQQAISNGRDISEQEQRTWVRNSVNSRALYDHLRNHVRAYDAIVMGPYLFGLIFEAGRICPEKTVLVPCLHDEPFAYLSIMRELFDSVAGFMFNAEPERELASRLFSIPDEKCHVVGMGLDDFNADPDDIARAYKKINAPYLIYAGRREPLKGTPLLLDYVRAFRERTGRDIKLVFTGSGEINAPAELAEHIVDLGFVSEEKKHNAMAGALAFIHPSINESFGIVLLESWLAQTPVLVHTQSHVLRWQCQRSGGGFWFRNYPEFEEELLLLLKNKKLRDTLGTAGRAYVLQEYNWERVGNKLLDVLNSLRQPSPINH